MRMKWTNAQIESEMSIIDDQDKVIAHFQSHFKTVQDKI